MKFIKKKNLQEGEELLYVPQLHWFYTVKGMVLSLPYFLVLMICWRLASSLSSLDIAESIVRIAIRNAFLVGILIILLAFAWRIFQYLSTEYGITNKRLIMKKGVLRLQTTEIPTDRIESIYCVQGLFGRLFRYGHVYISGIGGKMPLFYMVHRPYALRRKIVEIIEKNKAITIVHGDLPKPKPPVAKPEPTEEPMCRYGTFVRVLSEAPKA